MDVLSYTCLALTARQREDIPSSDQPRERGIRRSQVSSKPQLRQGGEVERKEGGGNVSPDNMDRI